MLSRSLSGRGVAVTVGMTDSAYLSILCVMRGKPRMDAAASRRMNNTAMMLFLFMMLFLQRPDHGNSSSLTDFTLNFKPPAVGLSDHLTKTQSQPGPAQLPAAGLVYPVERFRD